LTLMAVGFLVALPLGAQRANPRDDGKIHLGISVLLDEQVSLIRNRRIVLVTDAGAKDERGRSVSELFAKDRRVTNARVRVAGEVIAPAATPWSANAARVESELDSLSAQVNGMVVDLIDHGSRSGTAPRALLTALRAAARRSVPVFVLDRPNPITGEHLEGPVLDSARAASDGVYGLPQRHGMTVGEMARYFNEVGKIGATLTVVPVRGWRRAELPSERGLGPKRDAALLAPALGLCVATNVSCSFEGDRGTLAAPWITTTLRSALGDRLMPGVEFTARAGALSAVVENREQASASRIVTAIFAEARRLYPNEFAIDRARIAELTGSAAYADAILAGEDSDAIIDKQLPLLVEFRRRVRPFLLYR
jgi:uncharacterized protein YbbC (DUF1343 family)